jgi:hypothetical protein
VLTTYHSLQIQDKTQKITLHQVESSNDLKIQVFWDMMPSLTGGYHHSKETCNFHPQGSARRVGS